MTLNVCWYNRHKIYFLADTYSVWKAYGDYTVPYYWPGYSQSHPDVRLQSREWFWFPASVYIPERDFYYKIIFRAYVNDIDQADIAIDDIAILQLGTGKSNQMVLPTSSPTIGLTLFYIFNDRKCDVLWSHKLIPRVITARIRRMGEGNVFSLSTSGGGGGHSSDSARGGGQSAHSARGVSQLGGSASRGVSQWGGQPVGGSASGGGGSLHGRQYASCVHAGGLSCYNCKQISSTILESYLWIPA